MDTVWDTIYKEYQNGGQAWATLKEELHPTFLNLIQNNVFSHKIALDIGCGTGKYLKCLEQLGFKVTGIDSSPTAIEMAGRDLSSTAMLYIANMYEYYPGINIFDLVVSHATLHHGKKNDVLALLDRLYQSIVPAGKFFISLPSNDSQINWAMMVEHEEIDDGTLIPLRGPEKGLAHSFYSADEIDAMFSVYSKYEKYMQKQNGRWIITGEK
jgi:SAM-dependent methyltransferase